MRQFSWGCKHGQCLPNGHVRKNRPIPVLEDEAKDRRPERHLTAPVVDVKDGQVRKNRPNFLEDEAKDKRPERHLTAPVADVKAETPARKWGCRRKVIAGSSKDWQQPDS